MELSIRPATLEDAEAILAIYRPYIESTSITFEYEVPSEEEFRLRMKTICEKFPWLVCMVDGKTAGYAYASPHHERAAYQWNADLSVYVSNECQGMGIGTILYAALINLLKAQGFYNLYVLIAYPNKKSESLHRHFGFTDVGLYKNTGYKFGEWHDVLCMVKTLRDFGGSPTAPVPFSALGTGLIADILRKSLL